MSDVLTMSRFYHTIWQAGGKIKLLASGWTFNSYCVYNIDAESELAIKLMFDSVLTSPEIKV